LLLGGGDGAGVGDDTAIPRITNICAGSAFGLLLSGSGMPGLGGRVFGFGDNSKGQLGVGHLNDLYEPTVVFQPSSTGQAGLSRGLVGLGTRITDLAAGDGHGLALDSEGSVYSWGALGGPCTGHGMPNPATLIGAASVNKRGGNELREALDRAQLGSYLSTLSKEERQKAGLPESDEDLSPTKAGLLSALTNEPASAHWSSANSIDSFSQMCSLASQFRLRSVPFWWTRPRQIKVSSLFS